MLQRLRRDPWDLCVRECVSSWREKRSRRTYRDSFSILLLLNIDAGLAALTLALRLRAVPGSAGRASLGVRALAVTFEVELARERSLALSASKGLDTLVNRLLVLAPVVGARERCKQEHASDHGGKRAEVEKEALTFPTVILAGKAWGRVLSTTPFLLRAGVVVVDLALSTLGLRRRSGARLGRDVDLRR